MNQRATADRGTSITELLISMMLLGVVIATTAVMTISFQRTNGQNMARQDQIDVARATAERMTKTIRTAIKPSQLPGCTATACDVDAFISASQTSMQFYANLQNTSNLVGPRRVTYSVATTGANAGKLVEKVQVPESATPGAAGYVYCDAEAAGATALCKSRLKVRTLASGVLSSGTEPLFRFYGSSGSELPLTPGVPLTAAQIEQVLSVEILVKVQGSSPTRPKPTTYIQRVLLPNTQAVLRNDVGATP